MAHGARGAVFNAVQGGKAEHRFTSGFLGAVSGAATSSIGSNTLGAVTARTAIAAAIGGSASSLGGGSFASGAVTSSFTVLFNDIMHDGGGGPGDPPGDRSKLVKSFFTVLDTVLGVGEISAGLSFMATPGGQLLGIYMIGDGVIRVGSSLASLYGIWSDNATLSNASTNIPGLIGVSIDSANSQQITTDGTYKYAFGLAGDFITARGMLGNSLKALNKWGNLSSLQRLNAVRAATSSVTYPTVRSITKTINQYGQEYNFELP